MKIEIAILCIDDGRVPRHRTFLWEVKGNTSRDVRMNKVYQTIKAALKAEFPNPNPKKKDSP